MKRNDLQEGKRHYDSQYLIGARRGWWTADIFPSCAQQCCWEALRRLHFRCNARLSSHTRRVLDANEKLIVRAILWNMYKHVYIHYLLRQIHTKLFINLSSKETSKFQNIFKIITRFYVKVSVPTFISLWNFPQRWKNSRKFFDSYLIYFPQKFVLKFAARRYIFERSNESRISKRWSRIQFHYSRSRYCSPAIAFPVPRLRPGDRPFLFSTAQTVRSFPIGGNGTWNSPTTFSYVGVNRSSSNTSVSRYLWSPFLI